MPTRLETGGEFRAQQAGEMFTVDAAYPQELRQAPTSIVLSTVESENVDGVPFVSEATTKGFKVHWCAQSSGPSRLRVVAQPIGAD